MQPLQVVPPSAETGGMRRQVVAWVPMTSRGGLPRPRRAGQLEGEPEDGGLAYICPDDIDRYYELLISLKVE